MQRLHKLIYLYTYIYVYVKEKVACIYIYIYISIAIARPAQHPKDVNCHAPSSIRWALYCSRMARIMARPVIETRG